MKKIFKFIFSSLVISLAFTGSASANGNLASNFVFDSVGTMSEQSIRNFLNSRPNQPTCLPASGAMFPEPKDYFNYGPNNVDAARVIYNSALYSDVNPQVILTTLQKEQTLITRTNCFEASGIDSRNKAMGMGCPDGGACPAPAYAGFHQQLMKGTWQLGFNRQRAHGNIGWGGNDNITYYGYMTRGNFKRCASCSTIFYDGYGVVDGQSVYMENGATASLYTYTPHLGQSFPGIFSGWFGSPTISGDNPIGNFDLIQQKPGAIRVAGWGLDQNVSGPAQVHFYVNGSFWSAVTADISRPDVGFHGFDSSIAWTASGNHQVCAWVIGDGQGAPNQGIGCKTIFINNDPMGSLDVTVQGPGTVRVAGWGLDRSTAAAASVHVYIDGSFRGSLAANINRPDVGPHGFDGTVPWTAGGNHQVCAWVVGDNIGAPNNGLGCRAIFINNDPAGSLDVVQPVSGAVRVAGWGLDRSLNGPASIHVYVNGAFVGTVTANINRPDVGPHGFDGTVPWTAGGFHQLCAWVVGDSNGAPNQGLGCRSFLFN